MTLVDAHVQGLYGSTMKAGTSVMKTNPTSSSGWISPLPKALEEALTNELAAEGKLADPSKIICRRYDSVDHVANNIRRVTTVEYDGNPLGSFTEIADINDVKTPALVNVTLTRPPVDPLVYATRERMKQPKDREWRKWQGALFRVNEVRAVYPTDLASSVPQFVVLLSNQALTFPQQQNFMGSGKTTSDWFIEHILEIEPEQKS
jgi:hypothetical protein